MSSLRTWNLVKHIAALARKRGTRNPVAAADQPSTNGQSTPAAAVWKMLAKKLSSGAYAGSSDDLVRGVERLLGEASWSPLLEGGVTDHLDPRARSVRLFGPVGSGKTTCARRIVRQAIAAGRHVTVICSTFPGSPATEEYSFNNAAGLSLTVRDAEVFRTPENGCRSTLQHEHLDAIWKEFSTGGPETVVVDALLPPNDLRALVGALHRALSQRADTTLVVSVRHLDDCDASSSMPIVFDTEIVLPGDQYVDREQIRRALERLASDDFTHERLVVCAAGGGIAESPAEDQIISWFPPLSSQERFLARNRSQSLEGPASSIAVGDRKLTCGLMKGPDRVLSELRMEQAPAVSRLAPSLGPWRGP